MCGIEYAVPWTSTFALSHHLVTLRLLEESPHLCKQIQSIIFDQTLIITDVCEYSSVYSLLLVLCGYQKQVRLSSLRVSTYAC